MSVRMTVRRTGHHLSVWSYVTRVTVDCTPFLMQSGDPTFAPLLVLPLKESGIKESRMWNLSSESFISYRMQDSGGLSLATVNLTEINEIKIHAYILQ